MQRDGRDDKKKERETSWEMKARRRERNSGEKRKKKKEKGDHWKSTGIMKKKILISDSFKMRDNTIQQQIIK